MLAQRSFIVICVSFGILALGWFAWRNFSSRGPQQGEQSLPTVNKEPVTFATHSFDPASPPADMPPLSPGETAECDSDFQSNASVRGETQPSDATHANITITQVKMALQLKINIWLPTGANQHLIEHEEGHRQISEYYYQTADKVAERVAATFLGRRVDITGMDFASESNKILQQMASNITTEYSKQLDPGPAQLLYDSITDHGRNDVVARDAVAHAIKNVLIEAADAKNPKP